MNSKFKWLTYGIQKGLILFLGFVALWAGALVYIHLRSSNPLFIRWIKSVGFEKLFSFNHRLNIYLPVWFVYSLPSALWAFAYSILITGIWWFSSSWLKYFWLASIIVLAVGWEFLQLIGMIPGTFSFGDILAGITGALVGILLGINIIKPRYHEKDSI
jgi:hypothetical protein